MAQFFILDVNLRIQQVLGLEKVKQQLAGIQIGGAGKLDKFSAGLKSVGTNAAAATIHVAKGANATINFGKNAQKTGSQLKTAAKGAKNFGDSIFLAGKRYAAFLGATVVAFKAFQLISAGTKSVIEFDQAMVSLSQIIDTSVDQLQGLSNQFLDLSVTTGTSAAEIANAAKLLAQAGFRGSELTEAVEQLAKVPLTPIFENMDQAVDGAIAAMRQFADEGLTVESVFDKMINVSNKYAASFPDIIEGLKRGGSAFQAIGGTLDEFIAAFTTIRSVTRESASSVGTSLKTLSSRLADPKILKFLETKDIRLLEEGQFVGPLEAIRRIGEGLENTKNIQDRINIATKLGGRRQISRFLAVAQNAELTSEILGVSKDSFDAFSKVAEKGLQAVGKQIDILVAQAKKLAIDLGQDLFIPFIQGLTGTADAAIALLGALKPVLPIVAKLGALLAGGAILKGAGRFLGPRIAQLAGPAAFAAAGGGLRGAGAGLAASPFAQAGLLIAASEAAAALTRTADSADSFAATLITSVAGITAAIALFRSQTIAQFAAGGGLVTSLGKLGKLGALGGTLLTAGAIALPVAGVLELQRSQKDLSEKILKNVIESIDEIEIDPIDPRSLQEGFSEFATKISEGLQQSIERTDPFAAGIGIGERISRSFATGLRVMGQALEGDFEAIFSRGAVTTDDIRERFKEIIEKSPRFVEQMINNISQAMSTATEEQIPSGRYALTQIARQQGATIEDSLLFSRAIIEASGGLEEFDKKIEKNIKKIEEEADSREKLIKLTRSFIPTRLVSQLLQFSKAIDQTTKTINLSAKLFESQVAEITGGIRAPALDFDFDVQQVESLVRGGALKELFAFTPDIPRFIGAFSEVESLLDNFIINISNLPTGDIDLAGEIDKFFDFQKDVPDVVRENFGDFFNTIAQDIRNVAKEGKFIDADTIKQRFQKEFADLGVGTSDAVVESITQFMNNTFTQIEDELNRLATVRQFELDVAVRPETQAAFLTQQLRRVGVQAGGRQETNLMRGTIEELRLIQKEMATRRGRPGAVPGLLPTPRAGFFQGREQRLVDIAGDERIRQQVRDSFREVVVESSNLKKKLAELQPGTEGFLDASKRAKELSRSTIELQTTLEALDKATQQSLESEKRTLALRQQLELSQAEARLAERVRTGAITPIRADRILFDLAKEQEKAQITLQDKYDAIIEKDNALRVNLAKEISETTRTQAEITGDFGTYTNIFADATRMQVTAVELMQQSIANFGQAVVDFSTLSAVRRDIAQGDTADITATQIRSGGVTIQQSYDELNRLMNEGNASQEETLVVLRAIHERQDKASISGKDLSVSPGDPERAFFAPEAINNLIKSLDKLGATVKEPNEVKFTSDQRVELDLSTLPADVTDEVRPILEEAGLLIAKTVARKAMESLANKTDDSELAIAATDVAQELV